MPQSSRCRLTVAIDESSRLPAFCQFAVMVATNAVITWRDRHIPVKTSPEYHRGESQFDARFIDFARYCR